MEPPQLASARLTLPRGPEGDAYPFVVPAVRGVAALSPQRQLGLLALMREFVAKGAQFIVATHAPILLAYPGARLYSFDAPDGGPPRAAAYAELEHVRLTRDFLADPEQFLRHL